jgi:hypothetical protein
MTSRLTVMRIPHINTVVIKQIDGRDFFLTSKDSIVIGVDSLSFIIKFLVDSGAISPKLLEGILEDVHTDKGSLLP